MNSTATTTANITAAPLTIAAGSNSISFGGSFTPSETPSGLQGSDSVSGVTYTYAGSGYGPSTTKPTAVGTYSITPSAATFSPGSASNYTITYTAGTLTIGQTALAATVTASNKVYNGNTTATIATCTLTPTESGISCSATGGTFASSGVATGITVTASGIALSGSGSTNYSVNSTATTTANITAAPLTIAAGSNSISFGGSFTPSETPSGLQGSDSVSGVTYTYAGSGYGPSTTKPTAVGTYSITPSAATFSPGSASNYTITYTAGTLTIGQSALVATVTASNKVYNGNTTATIATCTLTPTESGISCSATGGTFASSGVATGITVTASGIALSGSGSTNYSVNSTATTTANITAAPLTIAAGSNSISFGGSFTPSETPSGLQGSDSVSGVTYTYAGSGYGPSTTKPTAVGTYSITPSAATFSPGSASNYTITYTAGTLTIGQSATSTTLTGLSTYVSGQTITVTATVSATGPGSGTPERHRPISDGTNTDVCTVTLVGGTGSCTFSEPTGTYP